MASDGRKLLTAERLSAPHQTGRYRRPASSIDWFCPLHGLWAEQPLRAARREATWFGAIAGDGVTELGQALVDAEEPCGTSGGTVSLPPFCSAHVVDKVLVALRSAGYFPVVWDDPCLDAAELDLLADAIDRRRRVHLTDRDQNGTITYRTVTPDRLMHHWLAPGATSATSKGRPEPPPESLPLTRKS